MSDKESDIQLFADKYPSPDSVHLAIMEVARLSHAGKHGQRVKELLGKLVAVECTAPAPQPDIGRLAVDLCRELYDRFMMGGWLPAEAYDETVAMLRKSLAATPQVTPTLKEILKQYGAHHIRDCDALNKWKELPCNCGFAALIEGTSEQASPRCVCRCHPSGNPSTPRLDLVCNCCDRHTCPKCFPENASEQAPPTPDKCPTCGSHSTEGYCGPSRCQDTWHSSAVTQKGTK